MEQTVLIAGKQSPFTDDLVQETLRRVSRVYASHDQTDTPPEIPDTFGDSLRYIPWTRRSLISARSIVLAIDQDEPRPDHVIIVCSPEGINSSLHETDAVVIEERIDAAIKGYLFLAREIASFFIRRGGGDLTILWYDPGMEILPPLDGAISGAVQGFARSMLSFYENEPFLIRTLYASEADGRAVANWVMEQVFEKGEKSAGRSLKFGQKMSLLPFRR